jgi:uncharacterized protein YndB with AHSA1/START domain
VRGGGAPKLELPEDNMPARTQFAHRLDRTVVISAPRDIVFRFFTDSARWATWWGAGSTIDAREGGKLFIRYPEGTEVSGEVIDVKPPDHIVFTYGYVKGSPIAPGGSRVTIRLEADGLATRVHLSHELEDATLRDQHIQGWRYQLSLFSNVVADEVHRGAGAIADAWFNVWAEPDAEARARTLGQIAEPGIRFHDRYSNINGLDELLPHIAAAQRFMPGMRMTRAGDVRHCQGTVLADFSVAGPGGVVRGRGTNVFVFGPTAMIESATGFMGAP